MITEDQLEQLAIQWFRDTARVNIEHRTPNIERRSEEKRRLAAEREALRTLTPALSHGEKEEDGRLVRRRDAMPGRVSHVVTKPGFRKERGEPLNKER